jgi:hypothetical protein
VRRSGAAQRRHSGDALSRRLFMSQQSLGPRA